MPDEGGQQIGSLIQPLQLLDQHPPQLGRVLGREVRQPPVLRVAPDRLIGVGVWQRFCPKWAIRPECLTLHGLVESGLGL